MSSSQTPMIVESPANCSSGGGGGIIAFILGIIIIAGGIFAVYYFFFYKKGEKIGMFSCDDDGNCLAENVFLKKDCNKECKPKPQPPFYIKGIGPGKPPADKNYWNLDTSGKNLTLGTKSVGWFVGLVNRSDANPRIWTISASGILCLAHPTTDKTQIVLAPYNAADKTQEIGIVKNNDKSLSFYFLDSPAGKKDFIAADISGTKIGCIVETDQSSKSTTSLWNWILEN